MIKRSISVLLATLLLLTMLSACGGESDTQGQLVPTNNGTEPTQETTTGSAQDSSDDEQTDTTQKEDSTANGPVGVVNSGVEYVNSVKESVQVMATGGFSYCGDSGLYGVMSMDGGFDSGEIYHDVKLASDCFAVRTGSFDTPENLDSVNCSGVIDANGKVIVPAEYALVEALGDRYFRAYKVTGLTEDSNHYLVRLSKRLFSLTAADGDVLYTGQWYVFDSQTGKEVPGVAGTTAAYVYQNGEVLSFTENGQKICKNAAGEDIPQDAQMFADGSYIPQGENTVYGPDKQKRFDFVDGEYSPYSWQNGLYTLAKYENSGSSYVLADETGKVCSKAFTDRVEVIEGGLVATDNGVYDLQGKEILAVPYYLAHFNNGNWLIRDEEKNVYLVDSNYDSVKICQLDDNYVYSFSSSNFTVTKNVEQAYYYYSMVKKDFVEGYPIGLGVAEREIDDNNKELIDTQTDTVLLSGYSRYTFITDDQGARYIYAYTRDENYESIHDIFILK